MDPGLVARAKGGDRAALDALLESQLNTVYRFVSVKLGDAHPDLDDVVQETLIGAAGSVGRLRGDSRAQVAGWLLSIARHKLADHLRRSYRRRADSIDAAGGHNLTDPAVPVEEQVARRDRAERLRQALGTLTAEQEEVVVLRFVLGFGIDEVAQITGRPSGAVKSMQHRALASLQRQLRSEEAMLQ